VLDDEGNKRLQLCKWAPTKNALAYVKSNNIFYKSAADSPTIHKLTTDGVSGKMYNGVPDWVYEGIKLLIAITCSSRSE
jgi:Dipeptidyl peptidase IV (DPP IV) N-terminal region